jgi:hypothetical protein
MSVRVAATDKKIHVLSLYADGTVNLYWGEPNMM